MFLPTCPSVNSWEKHFSTISSVSKGSSISQLPVEHSARFGITRFYNGGRGGGGTALWSGGRLLKRLGARRSVWMREADKAISAECIPGRCSALRPSLFLLLLLVYFLPRSSPRRARARHARRSAIIHANFKTSETPYGSYGSSPIVILLF